MSSAREARLLGHEKRHSPVGSGAETSDDDLSFPRLAESLGYLRREGIVARQVLGKDFASEYYLLHAPY